MTNTTSRRRLSASLLVLAVQVLLAACAQNVSPSPAPTACVPSGGTLYEVGPGQPYGAIGAVPWESLTAGDTVRIHWRAEPYREKVLLRGQGSAERPITVCGVAGPGGELPVISGENATTRPTMGYNGQGTQTRGLIHVASGSDDPWGYKPSYIVVQGLHLTGAFHENSFTDSAGAVVAYNPNAAGIFVERGEHITVRGVLITGNGNGFFVASGDSEEVRSRAIVLEYSALYGNGTVTTGFDRHHNIYTESEGMLVQFNYIGPLRDGSGGSALKDRSTGTVIRYNWIEGGARTLDLVDAEDSSDLATAQPEYRATYVYGNVLVNGPGGPSYMVHYGGDSGVTDAYRKGTLYFFHNTVVIRSDQEGEGGRWRIALFDVSTDDESVDARNNVVHIEPATPGARPSDLSWMVSAGALVLGANWASPGVVAFRDGVEVSGTVSGMENVLSNAANDPGFRGGDADSYQLRPDGAAVDAGQALHPAAVAAGHTASFVYVPPAAARPRVPIGPPDLGAFELVPDGASRDAPLRDAVAGLDLDGGSGRRAAPGTSTTITDTHTGITERGHHL